MINKKSEPMYVIKRNGNKEVIRFDKITNRIQKLLYDIDDIDAALITQKICNRIFSGISTTELDNLASQVCMSMVTDNPNFGVLGGRIAISNHQKNTKESFLEVVKELKNNKDIHGIEAPLVNDEIYDLAHKYEKEIKDMIDMNRDYLLDFFGFKTLEKSYLLKANKKIVERPQHLFMRVALGIHGNDLENVKKTYDGMSLKNYTHATPTLFNSGTPRQQFASCFLTATEDSIEGIFETLTECAKISKWSGGIGVHISNIRADGSYIRKTGGYSDGIMPMLKVYNDVARYVNQGGGKRNGSFAMYIEPWHADIFTFLEAKKNHGSDEIRARDLFYALWVPDLFMEMVEKDGDWYLMCPDKCPGLPDVYGENFNKLYYSYVEQNRYNKKIKARELWDAIISSQIETGVPYMSYKDHVNRKNNQKNIDTIRSSNLCVSGDTMILTKDGYYEIKSLENNDIKIWNGKEWSNTKVIKTGQDQKLLKIKFSNGLELKCTEYHKFYIETGSRPSEKSFPKIIEAKELKKDMKIIRYKTELVNDNNNNLKYAYTHGLYCADGTDLEKNIEKHRCNYKKQIGKNFCGRHLNHVREYFNNDEFCSANSYSDKPLLSLYKEKIKLLDYIDIIEKGTYNEKEDRITVSLPYDIEEKYYVPVNNSIESKIKWLEGYVDGDGCIIENNGIKNIQFSSNNLNFMRNIIYLLQTLGIMAQIKILKEEGFSLLPDGKGGKKLYPVQKSYRSNIDSISLNKLISMGFNPKRLDVSNSKMPHHITNMFIKIEDVIDENIYEDTYCFNEPLEHKGIFNGIITGQCNEINEVSNKDETAVCNLASICLPSVLEYPNKNDPLKNLKWYNLLNEEEREYIEYYFEGQLKLYSKDDCNYCKLLKSLLKEIGLKYEEIDEKQAENYRISLNLEPFETVPQLFSIKNHTIKHLGGYDDNWKRLSPKINHKKLYNVGYDLVVNLNKIIDKNYYPIEKTKVSNLRHRPIGIGVQGLADLFIKLRLPFDSLEAMKINKELFETIYYGSLVSSYELSQKDGEYSTFKGSPLSEGLFQYQLWGLKDEDLSGRWNWKTLRKNVIKYGVRNSLLTALMPTASTSQIMGFNECFEPITSNLYLRRTLAGEFIVINKYLIKDLITLDLWNEDIKDRLIYDNGSVQKIKNLPKFLKDIYKTVWEIPQKNIIQMSADRGPFICQSQSLNLFFETPEYKKLTMAHLMGWKLGLKTGSYYIRSKPALNAQKFGLDANKEKQLINEDDDNTCMSCSA
jgi:ribonucleoside-diphosphate reductase alpha chain